MIRLILTACLLFSSMSQAEELIQFINGQIANAQDVNSNFQILDERLSEIEVLLNAEASYSSMDGLTGGWYLDVIDCSQDPKALGNEALLKEKDLIHVQLIGECEINADFLVTGQKILLDGGDVGSDGVTCETTASLKFPDVGDNQKLIFTLNSASVLYLKCLTLSARDGVQLNAFSNSYIRTEYGVTLTSGGLSIFLAANSLYRTFYPTGIQTLSLQRGSLAEIYPYDGNSLALGSVSLLMASNFVCRRCQDVTITTLTLSDASLANFDRPLGTLNIDYLKASQRSSLNYPQEDCSKLQVTSAALYSDSKVYQGSNGDLLCD